MKVSKSGMIWLFIASISLSLVFINLLSLRFFARVDLTKDNKFTLAAGSRKTMQELSDVMQITAYFTKGLPAPYASYARYVRDLLEEFRAASAGKLVFEFIDPAAQESEEDKLKKQEVERDIFGRAFREATEVESELVALGIQPVEIRVIEDDQQQSKRAYMGLVLRYQGKREVLSVVQDFGNLEKDLTVRMRKLVQPAMPVVALYSDLAPDRISMLRSLVKQAAQLKELSAEELAKNEFDADSLVVVGTGKGLDEKALKAIDSHVSVGRNAAFFIDQYEFDPQTLQAEEKKEVKNKTTLQDLLASYGVSLGQEVVADVQCASLNVQEQRGTMVFSMPTRYPFIPQVIGLNQNSAVTYGLAGAIMPFVSPITLEAQEGVEFEILASSSTKSWLESAPFNTDPTRQWTQDEISASGPYLLGVSLKGSFKSYFAKDVSETSSKRSRLLVFGTSAFTWDPFLGEENQALALSSIDYLSSDDAILSMRSRNFIDLPLDPQISDRTRNFAKFANILGVPALLVIYGLFRWRRREKKRRSININSI